VENVFNKFKVSYKNEDLNENICGNVIAYNSFMIYIHTHRSIISASFLKIMSEL
jgi:hypothetical protein